MRAPSPPTLRLVLASTLALGSFLGAGIEARADEPAPAAPGAPRAPASEPAPAAPGAPRAPARVPLKPALPPPLAPRAKGSASPPAAHPPFSWVSVLDVRSVPSFLLFAGGALSGLTLHELGHVFTNLAYGNVPALTGILYAKFIPWFVVDPRIVGRNGVYYKHDGSVFRGGAHGYYIINTAGFMVQNIGSEAILSARPGLLYERAPFVKGMLWMNMLVSIGYATASLIGTEDHHGDIYGAAQHSDYPHQVVAAMVFSHGALDLFRYFFPDSDWLPWMSRSTKVMFLGMALPFN